MNREFVEQQELKFLSRVTEEEVRYYSSERSSSEYKIAIDCPSIRVCQFAAYMGYSIHVLMETNEYLSLDQVEDKQISLRYKKQTVQWFAWFAAFLSKGANFRSWIVDSPEDCYSVRADEDPIYYVHYLTLIGGEVIVHQATGIIDFAAVRLNDYSAIVRKNWQASFLYYDNWKRKGEKSVPLKVGYYKGLEGPQLFILSEPGGVSLSTPQGIFEITILSGVSEVPYQNSLLCYLIEERLIGRPENKTHYDLFWDLLSDRLYLEKSSKYGDLVYYDSKKQQYSCRFCPYRQAGDEITDSLLASAIRRDLRSRASLIVKDHSFRDDDLYRLYGHWYDVVTYHERVEKFRNLIREYKVESAVVPGDGAGVSLCMEKAYRSDMYSRHPLVLQESLSVTLLEAPAEAVLILFFVQYAMTVADWTVAFRRFKQIIVVDTSFMPDPRFLWAGEFVSYYGYTQGREVSVSQSPPLYTEQLLRQKMPFNIASLGSAFFYLRQMCPLSEYTSADNRVRTVMSSLRLRVVPYQSISHAPIVDRLSQLIGMPTAYFVPFGLEISGRDVPFVKACRSFSSRSLYKVRSSSFLASIIRQTSCLMFERQGLMYFGSSHDMSFNYYDRGVRMSGSFISEADRQPFFSEVRYLKAQRFLSIESTYYETAFLLTDQGALTRIREELELQLSSRSFMEVWSKVLSAIAN